MGCLKLKVKQGEELNVNFTIRSMQTNTSTGKEEMLPMDLTGYNISFQVKTIPLEKVEPIIDKTITTTSDPFIDGEITDITNGKFYTHLTKEDTSFNTGEYSLIISLVASHTNDIISSDYCNGAKYIICEQ